MRLYRNAVGTRRLLAVALLTHFAMRDFTTKARGKILRKRLQFHAEEIPQMESVLKLEKTTQKLEAIDANLSGSTFTDVNLANAAFKDVNLAGMTVQNANLAGLRIRDADLRNASLENILATGMTIEGIPVDHLLAAYRAVNASGV